MANSAKIKLAYTGTDFTREYNFDNLTDEQCTGLKAKVQALNASLVGGTAGGLSSFFISDDFDATNGVGYFASIKSAQYQMANVTEIDLS